VNSVTRSELAAAYALHASAEVTLFARVVQGRNLIETVRETSLRPARGFGVLVDRRMPRGRSAGGCRVRCRDRDGHSGTHRPATI
jgi:hypothetical protein